MRRSLIFNLILGISLKLFFSPSVVNAQLAAQDGHGLIDLGSVLFNMQEAMSQEGEIGSPDVDRFVTPPPPPPPPPGTEPLLQILTPDPSVTTLNAGETYELSGLCGPIGSEVIVVIIGGYIDLEQEYPSLGIFTCSSGGFSTPFTVYPTTNQFSETHLIIEVVVQPEAPYESLFEHRSFGVNPGDDDEEGGIGTPPVESISLNDFGPVTAPLAEPNLSGTCSPNNSAIQILANIDGRIEGPSTTECQNGSWSHSIVVSNLVAGTELVIQVYLGSASDEKSSEVLEPGPHIRILSPLPGQQNTSIQPLFSWNISQVPGFALRYHWRVGPQSDFEGCDASNWFLRSPDDGVTGTSFQGVGGVKFENETTYVWCVRATDQNQVEFAPWVMGSFRTQRSDPSAPTISVTPLSSSQQPEGQVSITISGTNAEPAPSKVEIYQVLANEDILITTQALVDAAANYSFPYEIADTSFARTLRFKSRIKRPSGQSGEYIFSNFSQLAEYHFDPSLMLDTPELEASTNGEGQREFSWGSVDDATHYKLWRRLGFELCEQDLDEGIECYLDNRPFLKIAELQVGVDCSPVAGSCQFTDNSLSPNQAAKEASYFVTAHEGGTSSLRSNSISFNDTRAPGVLDPEAEEHPDLPSLRFQSVYGGYQIHTYLCDIDNFKLDNSADLYASVQFATREVDSDGSADCKNIEYDALTQDDLQLFDSLTRYTAAPHISGCVLAHIRDSIPGKAYCHSVCLSDISGNGRCYKKDEAFDNPDNETGPDFQGVNQVLPGEDGHSLLVSWMPASTNDNQPMFETLEYRIFHGEVDKDGKILWSDSLKPVDDPYGTHGQISGLKTGTQYAVRVAALNRRGIVEDASKVLFTKTLDNNPRIDLVDIRPAKLPGHVKMQFGTWNRLGLPTRIAEFEVILPNRTVSISSLEAYSVGPAGFQSTSNGQDSESSVVVDLSSFLDVEALNKGLHYNVTIEAYGPNGQSYLTTKTGSASLLEGASTQTSNFSSPSFASGACHLNLQSQSTPGLLLLLWLIALAFWLLRINSQRSEEIAKAEAQFAVDEIEPSNFFEYETNVAAFVALTQKTDVIS
ncbi:MAG: hypothetical protein EA369_08995 [Bradymonadales bacterium]|nr:MAG: hypothetical protein EA369_08995 [Bradymonadales bacterium]